MITKSDSHFPFFLNNEENTADLHLWISTSDYLFATDIFKFSTYVGFVVKLM